MTDPADTAAGRIRAWLNGETSIIKAADVGAVLNELLSVSDRYEIWRNLAKERAGQRNRLAARVAELEARIATPNAASAVADLAFDSTPDANRCTAEWPSRRITVRCDRPAGHDQEAHRADLAGGHVSWHGPDGTVPAECECGCQPGQPCLCPERDCYCGPCPVCDRKEADHA
jgi:hypothetical protein